MAGQDGKHADKLRDCFSCQGSEHGDLEKGNGSDGGGMELSYTAGRNV